MSAESALSAYTKRARSSTGSHAPTSANATAAAISAATSACFDARLLLGVDHMVGLEPSAKAHDRPFLCGNPACVAVCPTARDQEGACYRRCHRGSGQVHRLPPVFPGLPVRRTPVRLRWQNAEMRPVPRSPGRWKRPGLRGHLPHSGPSLGHHGGTVDSGRREVGPEAARDHNAFGNRLEVTSDRCVQGEYPNRGQGMAGPIPRRFLWTRPPSGESIGEILEKQTILGRTASGSAQITASCLGIEQSLISEPRNGIQEAASQGPNPMGRFSTARVVFLVVLLIVVLTLATACGGTASPTPVPPATAAPAQPTLAPTKAPRRPRPNRPRPPRFRYLRSQPTTPAARRTCAWPATATLASRFSPSPMPAGRPTCA